jgi:hypothetical protein
MYNFQPSSWAGELSELALGRKAFRRGNTTPPATGGEPAVCEAHYVSSVDGAQLLLLAGPFATRRDASSWIDAAEGVLLSRGALEVALEVRVTTVLTRPGAARPGDMNHLLGVPDLAH